MKPQGQRLSFLGGEWGRNRTGYLRNKRKMWSQRESRAEERQLGSQEPSKAGLGTERSDGQELHRCEGQAVRKAHSIWRREGKVLPSTQAKPSTQVCNAHSLNGSKWNSTCLVPHQALPHPTPPHTHTHPSPVPPSASRPGASMGLRQHMRVPASEPKGPWASVPPVLWL